MAKLTLSLNYAEKMKMNRKSEKINKDTYILEIINKAREWQKTKSISTSSNVCKMLNLLADAVPQIAEYPTVSVAWATYLGMAVAKLWDEDWIENCNTKYEQFYGDQG